MSDEFRMVGFDTETTGFDLKNCRIIEVGFVEMINRKITGRTYTQRFNPQVNTMMDGAEAVHGISLRELHGEPTFADRLGDMLRWLGKTDIVGHRISFDFNFFDMEVNRLPAVIRNKYTTDAVFSLEKYIRVNPRNRSDHDTGKMSKKVFGQYMKLDALCDKAGVDRSKRVKHGALLDAELCALCYLSMTRTNMDMFTKPVQKEQKIVRLNRVSVKPLLVIKATSEELSAQQDMYEWMAQDPLGHRKKMV